LITVEFAETVSPPKFLSEGKIYSKKEYLFSPWASQFPLSLSTTKSLLFKRLFPLSEKGKHKEVGKRARNFLEELDFSYFLSRRARVYSLKDYSTLFHMTFLLAYGHLDREKIERINPRGILKIEEKFGDKLVRAQIEGEGWLKVPVRKFKNPAYCRRVLSVEGIVQKTIREESGRFFELFGEKISPGVYLDARPEGWEIRVSPLPLSALYLVEEVFADASREGRIRERIDELFNSFKKFAFSNPQVREKLNGKRPFRSSPSLSDPSL